MKVTLNRKICLNVNSTTQRCPNIIFTAFFPFATGVNDTGGAPLGCEYHGEFLKKIETAPTGYSGT